MAKLGGEMRFW